MYGRTASSIALVMAVKILRNEKYIGDALLQKTYTTDFLTKTRTKNNGTVLQYCEEGDHEAVIPKDIFLLVQEELVLRRVVHTSDNGNAAADGSVGARGVYFSANSFNPEICINRVTVTIS